MAQAVVAFGLKRCLPQTVKDVSLLLRWGGGEEMDGEWTSLSVMYFKQPSDWSDNKISIGILMGTVHPKIKNTLNKYASFCAVIRLAGVVR